MRRLGNPLILKIVRKRQKSIKSEIARKWFTFKNSYFENRPLRNRSIRKWHVRKFVFSQNLKSGPLSSTPPSVQHIRGFWRGTEGCVEVSDFRCWTEGRVELRGFWCWTEGFLMLNWEVLGAEKVWFLCGTDVLNLWCGNEGYSLKWIISESLPMDIPKGPLLTFV